MQNQEKKANDLSSLSLDSIIVGIKGNKKRRDDASNKGKSPSPQDLCIFKILPTIALTAFGLINLVKTIHKIDPLVCYAEDPLKGLTDFVEDYCIDNLYSLYEIGDNSQESEKKYKRMRLTQYPKYGFVLKIIVGSLIALEILYRYYFDKMKNNIVMQEFAREQQDSHMGNNLVKIIKKRQSHLYSRIVLVKTMAITILLVSVFIMSGDIVQHLIRLDEKTLPNIYQLYLTAFSTDAFCDLKIMNPNDTLIPTYNTNRFTIKCALSQNVIMKIVAMPIIILLLAIILFEFFLSIYYIIRTPGLLNGCK